MTGNDWSMIDNDWTMTDVHPLSEFERETCDGNCRDIRQYSRIAMRV